MSYDEDKVLTDYIWSHAYEYMTDLEKLGYKAVNARFKAENAGPEMAKVLLEKWGGKNDPRVNEVLSRGEERFREAVRDRILRDHPEIVNRCPECGRIVRTPRAMQCNWCFCDWHAEI